MGGGAVAGAGAGGGRAAQYTGGMTWYVLVVALIGGSSGTLFGMDNGACDARRVAGLERRKRAPPPSASSCGLSLSLCPLSLSPCRHHQRQARAPPRARRIWSA